MIMKLKHELDLRSISHNDTVIIPISNIMIPKMYVVQTLIVNKSIIFFKSWYQEIVNKVIDKHIDLILIIEASN